MTYKDKQQLKTNSRKNPKARSSMCIETCASKSKSEFGSSNNRRRATTISKIWLIVLILAWIVNISQLIYVDIMIWNQISRSLSTADDLKYVLEALIIDWNQNSFEKDIIEMKFTQLINSKQDVYLSQETFDILRGLSIFLGIYNNHPVA